MITRSLPSKTPSFTCHSFHCSSQTPFLLFRFCIIIIRVSSIAFAKGSESNKLNTRNPPTLETLRSLQAHKSFGGLKPCFPAVQPPKYPPLRLWSLQQPQLLPQLCSSAPLLRSIFLMSSKATSSTNSKPWSTHFLRSSL